MRKFNELILDEFEDEEYDSRGGSVDHTDVEDMELEEEEFDGEVDGDVPAQQVPDSNQLMMQMLQQNQELMQRSFQQQNQGRQTPQYTPEQIDQALKVYRMNPEVFGKIFNDQLEMEERVGAMQSMIDGISQHAATLALLMTNRAQQQMQERFQPAMQLVERQQLQEFTGAIESEYPALKNQRQLINMAVQSLKSEGFQEPDPRRAREAVATRVEQIVRMTNPSFNVRGGQQNQTQHQSGHGMPRMGSGGNGGAGGNANRGNGQRKRAGWASVFS